MGELKNIRKEKKLTQQQAADLIGMRINRKASNISIFYRNCPK